MPNRQHFAHCICTQNYGRATYYYHHDMYVCTRAVEGLGTIYTDRNNLAGLQK